MPDINPRTRVYVAGAYQGATVLETLDNMRIGMKAAKDLLRQGYAPYCPWLDYQYQLMLADGETLTTQDFYDYSLSWLAVSDAMMIVDNPRNEQSKGLRGEIAFAAAHDIPITLQYGDFTFTPIGGDILPTAGGYVGAPEWIQDIVKAARTVKGRGGPIKARRKDELCVDIHISDDEVRRHIEKVLTEARDDPILKSFARFDFKCDAIISARSKSHNVGTSPENANTIAGILDPATSYLGHHQECTERLHSAIRRGAPVDELVELACDAVNYLRFYGAKKMEGKT
ncbi:MAG: hypothetical protein WC455_12310 [Dehalococcoidia bacterium]|jgi:hypothetical protein